MPRSSDRGKPKVVCILGHPAGYVLGSRVAGVGPVPRLLRGDRCEIVITQPGSSANRRNHGVKISTVVQDAEVVGCQLLELGDDGVVGVLTVETTQELAVTSPN